MVDFVDPVEEDRAHFWCDVSLALEVVGADRECSLQFEQICVNILDVFSEELRIPDVIVVNVLDLVEQL